MTAKQLLVGISLISSLVPMTQALGAAVPEDVRVVRLAELAIDPAQLESYRAELKREIEASIRMEPGVLTLYAVAIKAHSDQIRLFEVYRDQAAYQSHLQTPHFIRYKAMTQGMVKNLTFLETEPILLCAKPQ